MPVPTRLPGIQFEVVAPSAPEALVRMDIAVFVGFAACGPLQTPVAVEDIAQFEEIFGDDLVIADDPASNQQIYALLPSSVRAFFRNGGRRCWIVRVADSEAKANRFAIPGLFEFQEDSLTRAYADARSEGSWSDSLAVGAALRSEAIEVVNFTNSPVSFRLLLSSLDDVVAGDLLKLTFANGSGGEDLLWFFVGDVRPVTNGSPPSPGRMVDVSGGDFLWQASTSPPSAGLDQLCESLGDGVAGKSLIDLGFTRVAPADHRSLPLCERITMDMFAQSESQTWSLSNLAFAPSHPRYWANLPNDVNLYGADNLEGLAAETSHPRFPLAGEFDGASQKGPQTEASDTFYLPLCVAPLPVVFNGPDLPENTDPIIRDGVSNFQSDLFVDGALADCSSFDLLQKADSIRYQSTQPRKLTGMHAALAIDEATIIAVPDAVQRGWFQAPRAMLASPLDSSPLQNPGWHLLNCQQPQQDPSLTSPPAGFQPCEPFTVEAPALTLSSSPGRFLLEWNSTKQPTSYTDVLEEAIDPQFSSAEIIYKGASGKYTVYRPPAGDYYYRVRRQVCKIWSNYSNCVGLRVDGETDWQVYPANRYQNDTLLAVHGALLRMCAARGDMFAVLAMPQHYRESETRAHSVEVKALLLGDDAATPSFGALYHPWLIGREEDDLLNLRATPPDGAMAGIMATRSTQRGPWISPANELLHGVVDMTPPIARNSRQALQDALINLIRQEPNGFLCLCELTLSDNPDLSPINVRRLLSFLRKTVLRAGANYVFEPNNNEFRRSVQRGFEILLDRLLALGAFAGRISREAFQVVTDSSLNNRQAVDQGKFIVELRVAPSVPLRFLTVRLLQTADRTFVTEGGV